jgi:hypothetical protein
MDPIRPAVLSSDYLSPTLDLLAPEQRPSPLPACGHCQRGMWFLAESSLKCYCKSMQLVIWDGVKPPVRCCDGQLLPATRTEERAGQSQDTIL